MPTEPPSYESLVAEAESAPTDGWDFSWFEGRATEARPSWGYAVSLAGRLARADAALDLDTGGGEVMDFALARTATPPRVLAATEAWPPNAARATRLLRPRGVVVVTPAGDGRLPFPDAAFDLVSSRHPVTPHWREIARVLTPGGTYFAQHVGHRSAFELVEEFLGPLPDDVSRARHPDAESAAAKEAGLDVVDVRVERLRMEFHDVGAVVHFLRKVVWMVPGFTVARYEAELRALHERIGAEGPFVAYSARHLIEARRPLAG
ncbi:class I SAM-dependent methyltransferase [Streptomyces roseirectus]|uniref:Class I SAM-dependent methyltransferase n=1 Tax=Streptomyces roseirectus TaxID=2768066 RepID=A0A7H0ICG2_9ACTN|nr:methyltransferase domain-containing protein [Streptomyces roseirectus]QNP70478.1 class I SAM-dependent methyltransferase [Streptomyces roseirectus]